MKLVCKGRVEHDGEQGSARIVSSTQPWLSTISQGKVELAHTGSWQWLGQEKRDGDGGGDWLRCLDTTLECRLTVFQIEPRAFCMLRTYSAIRLYLHPCPCLSRAVGSAGMHTGT